MTTYTITTDAGSHTVTAHDWRMEASESGHLVAFVDEDGQYVALFPHKRVHDITPGSTTAAVEVPVRIRPPRRGF